MTIACPGYVKTNLSLNALTGDGTAYGKMDETTEKGYDPSYVAEKVLRAAAAKKDEIVIAKPDATVAIYLKTLCPKLLNYFVRRKSN